MIFKNLYFGKDEELRRKYVSHLGNIRFGMLLEFLDLMAGETAMQYLQENKENALTVVTAAVDEINICKPIRKDTNVRFTGEVASIGKSSIEVLIDIFADNEKSTAERAAHCQFTMVALDSLMKPTTIVKKYEPLFTWQKIRLQELIDKKKKYFEKKGELLLDNWIGLYDKLRDVGEIEMEDTVLENNFVMFPQQQNINGKIFGGYLMRLAYEMAWTTALQYGTKERDQIPIPVRVDRINFYKPVEIGDVMQINSQVCHVGKTSLNIEVEIKKTNAEIENHSITNSCYFTFVMQDLEGNPKILPKIKPSATLEEIKKYLKGEDMALNRK